MRSSATGGYPWVLWDGFQGWRWVWLPWLWLLYKRSVRFRRFNLLLPEAVDLIARSLRAGQSLPMALVTVAEEIADPLGPEFRRCADEMNFGLPFREAMLNLFRRFPLQDLQFLISAILLQRETGGNLAELLDKTAALLRARIHLQQKVKVYTAQGRMTGAILLALPFIAFVLLNLVRPGYTAPLFETETRPEHGLWNLGKHGAGGLLYTTDHSRSSTDMTAILIAIFAALALFAASALVLLLFSGKASPTESRLAALQSQSRAGYDATAPPLTIRCKICLRWLRAR